MKTIVGILFLLFSAWGVLVNLIPLASHVKLKSGLRDAGIDDPAALEHMAPMFEYHMSMLLIAVGAGTVGAFYIFGGDLTLVNMGGALIALFGYGAVIQSFRKYDTAAQVASRGGDAAEFGRTLRFSLFYGLALLAFGGYLAL